MELKLCQPASIILLFSIAGAIYHFLAADIAGLIYWLIVAILGTGVFQTLCYAGFEPIAWIFMLIPVLIVCFFLAIAIFASSMRINNVSRNGCKKSPRSCDRCLGKSHC